MSPVAHKARNLLAAFSLRGGRLRKCGRGVVSYAPFLIGAASAVVFGSMPALSTPSFAQLADRIGVAAVDDVVAGDEGWIIAIDDVAADAGGWITAIDGVAAGGGGGIAAYAAGAGGGFAAFGDIVIETGGGIAAFGKVEEEIAITDGPYKEHGSNDADGVKISVVIIEPEDKTPPADDVVDEPEEETAPAGDIITGGDGITFTTTFTDDPWRNCRWVKFEKICGYGSTVTTVTASGNFIGGGEGAGVSVLRTDSSDFNLVNNADISNVDYGIRVTRGSLGNPSGDLNVVNNGRITDVKQNGIDVTISDGGNLLVSTNSVTKGNNVGVYARHNGSGNISLSVGPEASVSGGGYESGYGIHAHHAGSGRIRIDIAGSVLGLNGRDAVYMSGGTRHELALRPGFVLDGKPVVSSPDDGARLGVLTLDQPHADSSVSSGFLNLGAEEFRGFRRFNVESERRWGENSAPGHWEVTGEASEEEAFGSAGVGGNLRFSNVNFKMAKRDDDPRETVWHIHDERGYRVERIKGAWGDNYRHFRVRGEGILEIVGSNRLRGSLINRGRIVFASVGEDDSLVVTEDHRGFIAELAFNVGADEWDEDKLTIEGNNSLVAGMDVFVNAPEDVSDSFPDKSPVLIQVHGYAQANDFVGEQTIGAFDYVLEYNTVGDVVSLPVYEDFSVDDFGFHTWHFRQDGLSSFAENSSDVPDAVSDSVTDDFDRDENPEGGIWAEQYCLRAPLEPGASADVGSRAHDDHDRIHFGFDIPAVNFMGGDVMVGTSMVQGFSTSLISKGSIGVESHAAALTASWQSPGGFYADGQTRYVRFSSDISTEGLSLVKDNEGAGVSASVEAGYRFAVPVGGVDFLLSPQMELIWSRVGFDDFVGPRGELVSLEDGDLVKGRLGLSWDGEWRAAGGSGRVYGRVNLRGALDGKTAVNVSGVSIASERNDLSVDGRLGVAYEWDEVHAVYGEAVVLSRDGEDEVRANLGARIDF